VDEPVAALRAGAPIALSELDSRRFGIRVARAELRADDLDPALAWCGAQRIDLLVARLPEHATPPAAELARRGFERMDTLVRWTGDLSVPSRPQDAGSIDIRAARPDEAERVAALARRAFRGHVGHYHSDPRLDRTACDEVYADWAHRSSRAVGERCAVLLAERGSALVGFSVVRLGAPGTAEGVLSGVEPEYRGRGVYAALHAARSEWCRARGAKSLVASAAAANAAITRCYERAGLTPSHACHTFHAWPGTMGAQGRKA